ncbi:MAG: hypothetical protein ACTHMG_00640 [Sphingomonas sp.]
MTLPDRHHPRFQPLIDYLVRLPAIVTDATPMHGFASGLEDDLWWVKFAIQLDHSLTWPLIQELGHVLNYLSPSERLPTVFKPVSPPPYLNGGPQAYLSWVIECPLSDMDPATVAQWLDSRLPDPADASEWVTD